MRYCSPAFNDMAVIDLPRRHPHEGESIPLPRMSLSENHHHHPAANSSPVVGAESISMPVRVPCASQRRCTWPPSASVSDEHWANQENYFMAKSFKMYNRLLAAGLNVINVISGPPFCVIRALVVAAALYLYFDPHWSHPFACTYIACFHS